MKSQCGGPDFSYDPASGVIKDASGQVPEDWLARSWPTGVDRWRGLIVQSAERYGIHPSLAAAVMAQESRGDPTAISSAGAIGLMQLMRGTARRLRPGIRDDEIAQPEVNIDLGCDLLSRDMRRFGGNVVHVIAAYNAGGAYCGPARDCGAQRERNRWNLRTNCSYVDKVVAYANRAALNEGYAIAEPKGTGARGWIALGLAAAVVAAAVAIARSR